MANLKADEILKPSDLLEVGRIIDAYGLKGWVKVSPNSTDSVLAKLKTWWLEQPEGSFRSIAVVTPRVHGGTVVALPEGFNDRNQAEAIKGAKVWAARSEFPRPKIDEFYWADLVGCDVVDPQGLSLGRVIGLQDHGAHPILEIQMESVPDADPAARGLPVLASRLVPFVASIVSRVDLPAKQIHVQWRADFFD